MIVILFLFQLTTTHAQTSTHRLAIADSLFKAKKYTQSFEQYHNILKHKQYTPAMFLKMAYIQEGLNNIGLAMYYLNMYFLASNDKSVITKMETMAAKFNLKGYESSDAGKFLGFYHDYHFYISVFLVALCCLLLSIIFFVKFKRNSKPVASLILMTLVILVLSIHLNFGERIKSGVITEADTFVMEGPAAGSPVTEIINEGHRVEILGSKDVWLKVEWNDEVAYIKNNKVLPIEF